MFYSAKIKVPASKVEKLNELLAKETEDGMVAALGYPKDSTIECYTAQFSNGFFADIKLCSGDTNFFVDPVLFSEVGDEVQCLDCTDEYDGDYTFEVDGDTYNVIVEAVAEPCAFLYTEIHRGKIMDTDWFGETRIFKRDNDAYAHMAHRRGELKDAGYESAYAPYTDSYVKGESIIIPRVEVITMQ